MKSRRVVAIVFLATVLAASLVSWVMTKKQQKNEDFIIRGEELYEGPDAYPNEWMAYQRAFPYDEIKPEAYREAMKQARAIQKSSPEMRNDWELLGPTNIGGRITDIAIHPDDPFTWYIGGATGGIFKTLDGGEDWEHIFKDANTISVGDIAIDPNDKNIVYVGTGEANSSSYSFFGDGIYKSYDAGQTWEHIGLEESVYVGRIIVDYNDSERVFVAAAGTLFSPNEDRGVYKSEDGGETWEQVLFLTDSTSAIDLVQHPENPDIIYAAMWERMRGRNYRNSFGASSGIYISEDGGDSWDELTGGLPTGNDKGRIGIDICQSNPDVLYAFYDMPWGEVRVYRTDDGGETWDRKNDGVLDGMNSNFGWYFGQVRVDPANEDRVFVLGVYSYRSESGGNSWVEMGDWSFHVDHHALVIDEFTGMMVEGNDGGLYTSFNYGSTWAKINNLPLTQFYDIEVDYQNPYRIYGGTQDNNTIRTYTGNIYDWQVLLGGDGFYTLVDYTNPDIIYAEYQWGNLYKSTNGGGGFDYIAGAMSGDRTNWSSPLVMHPQEPSVLYFGTYRVWKSLNYGNSWSAVSPDLTDGDDGSTWHTVSTLAISPVNPNVVIAGTDDGHVHITQDGGVIWTEISEGLPVRWITRVAADPFDANTIYCTVSGFRWDESTPHVFKSTDLGETWTSISGNLPDLPVNVIVIDPEIPDRYIIGTDAGMFLTENGGNHWAGISEGLGNVAVTALKIHNPTRTLITGTFGLSAYKIGLDDLSVGLDDPQNTLSGSSLEIYPNPLDRSVGGGLTLSFSLDQRQFVQLEIVDVSGRIIHKLAASEHSKGKYTYQWNGKSDNGQDIPAGVYFCKLTAGEESSTAKLLIR